MINFYPMDWGYNVRWQSDLDLVNTKESVFLLVINLITRTMAFIKCGRKLKICGIALYLCSFKQTELSKSVNSKRMVIDLEITWTLKQSFNYARTESTTKLTFSISNTANLHSFGLTYNAPPNAYQHSWAGDNDPGNACPAGFYAQFDRW